MTVTREPSADRGSIKGTQDWLLEVGPREAAIHCARTHVFAETSTDTDYICSTISHDVYFGVPVRTREGNLIPDSSVLVNYDQVRGYYEGRAGAYVVLEELQERASAIIARATGAEAGMVTGGAAAGLLLATAACIAGEDPAKIAQLPDTTGMKGEAVMHRAHRNGYDHAVRVAGATIVDIGYGGSTLPYQLKAVLAVSGLFNLLFFVYPGPLVEAASAAAKSLF